MFDNIVKFFKKFSKVQNRDSKETAKERLHLVLMQDRANVSADFLELMKQEIIEVIKKYIDVDENSIDVKLTNKDNGDGTTGAPALYANIPIVSIKEETKKINIDREKNAKNVSENKEQETQKSKKKKENKDLEKSTKKAKKEVEEKVDVEKKEIVDTKNNNGSIEEKSEEAVEVAKTEEIKAEENKNDIQINDEEKENESTDNKDKIEVK